MTIDTATILAEVTLPWPARELHPNARCHWARRATATKAAREGARYRAMAEGWHRLDVPEDARLTLWFTFHPPDRRQRDDDGMLASMKASRDGLADALGIDDSRITSRGCLHDEVRQGGEVHVRLTLRSAVALP